MHVEVVGRVGVVGVVLAAMLPLCAAGDYLGLVIVLTGLLAAVILVVPSYPPKLGSVVLAATLCACSNSNVVKL